MPDRFRIHRRRAAAPTASLGAGRTQPSRGELKQGARRRTLAALSTMVVLVSTLLLWDVPPSSAAVVTQSFTGTLTARGKASHFVDSGPGTITATLSCGGRARVKVEIVNSSGVSLAGRTKFCANVPSASVSVSASGRYQIKLTEVGGYGTAYKLSVSHPALPTTTTTTTAPTTTTTTAPPPPSSSLAVRIQGNRLVDQSGKVVRLLGVNRSGTEYACAEGWGIFDGPSDSTSVTAMAGWHTNAVRVPLNETCWLGINGVNPAYSGVNYRSAIANYVKTLHNAGLVAVLDLHWSAPGTGVALKNRFMPNVDHSPDFWRSVATYFKNDPAVVFDLFNEPRDVDWACWRNGCTTVYGWRAAGMQSLVDAVRSTGATQPVLVPGLNYANDLSQWLTYRPTDSANQLGAEFHVYNDNYCNTVSCWESTVAPVAASVPVVTGESGQGDCARGFVDSYMSWADAKGISYLGWSWNPFDCSGQPALISSYDGTPTPYGVGLRDHLAALSGK